MEQAPISALLTLVVLYDRWRTTTALSRGKPIGSCQSGSRVRDVSFLEMPRILAHGVDQGVAQEPYHQRG